MKSSLFYRFGLALSLVIMILASGCTGKPSNPEASFNHRFESLVKPYVFNYASWEFKTLYNEIKQAGKVGKKTGISDSDTVVRFFSTASADQALKDEVENILASQINQVLIEEGIYYPFFKFHFTFPPVNFKIEKPPNLLVVSPRDRIEQKRGVTLKQDIQLNQVEELESRVEQLNVSALVIPLGGLGATFPSFVSETSDLKYTLETAGEEWLHQYLSFKPLGFRYVLELLRIKPDADIRSLNETVAGLAGKELGDLVYAKFYAKYSSQPEKPAKSAVFDFNAAMRETRLNLDSYLASGQVSQAETYLEQRRQFINIHGYSIRKLNQAYFAFYGSYAYEPTSIDPLGNQVRTLRQQSSSLKDFLQTASEITSRKRLMDSLKNSR